MRAETNRKKEFDYEAWEEEALTISFKIIIIKRQRNTAQRNNLEIHKAK